MTVIDVGGQVRHGEELDISAVETWLKDQGVELQGQAQVTQYSGGASNWTYRLEYDNVDLILRRPPKGTKAKSAHDMAREYNVQKHLAPHYPVLPEMLALCQDEQVIGCDFYVMKRIAGIILHQVPYQGTELEKLGKGEGYCRRQVEGWDTRYQKALTPNVPDFAFVRQWLQQYIPADSKTCVIHNDWRFDNVILDPQQPTKVIGVLDWEMATLGDPLMDLGSALAYWIQDDDDALMKSSRRQPTNLKGMLTRQQVVDYYLAKTGLQPTNWAFYEVFGLFRLAVIAQQIYYRYYHQQTDNPAFKDFWIMIHALHIRALKLIAENNVEAQQLIPEYAAKLQDILKR